MKQHDEPYVLPSITINTVTIPDTPAIASSATIDAINTAENEKPTQKRKIPDDVFTKFTEAVTRLNRVERCILTENPGSAIKYINTYLGLTPSDHVDMMCKMLQSAYIYTLYDIKYKWYYTPYRIGVRYSSVVDGQYENLIEHFTKLYKYITEPADDQSGIIFAQYIRYYNNVIDIDIYIASLSEHETDMLAPLVRERVKHRIHVTSLVKLVKQKIGPITNHYLVEQILQNMMPIPRQFDKSNLYTIKDKLNSDFITRLRKQKKLQNSEIPPPIPVPPPKPVIKVAPPAVAAETHTPVYSGTYYHQSNPHYTHGPYYNPHPHFNPHAGHNYGNSYRREYNLSPPGHIGTYPATQTHGAKSYYDPACVYQSNSSVSSDDEDWNTMAESTKYDYAAHNYIS